MKRIIVGIALIAATVAMLNVGGAQSAKRATLTATERLGPKTMAAPFDFATAVARCPRGYVATGGGSYAGAIEHVSDGPTSNGRGWFVDGFNPSDTDSYGHAATVICAHGNRLLAIRAARTQDRIAEARREFLRSR